MKIRTGFVANSSTSSFMMYGVCIDYDPEGNEEDEDGDFEFDYYSETEKVGLDHHHPEYSDHFIGISMSQIGDDETGKQFKDKTTKKVNEFLDKIGYKGVRHFSIMEEAWHD
jgi:hypothetical protein